MLRLPERDPEAFDSYVKYLYTSVIDDSRLDMSLQLYVLGGQMKDLQLVL